MESGAIGGVAYTSSRSVITALNQINEALREARSKASALEIRLIGDSAPRYRAFQMRDGNNLWQAIKHIEEKVDAIIISLDCLIEAVGYENKAIPD